MTYAWSTDSLIPNDENAYGISGPPAVVEFIDKLYLIHEGRGSDGYLWCATFDGQTWSDDNLIPDTNHAYGTSGPPAAVVFNDKLYCIREGRGGNGWMWYATFDGRIWSRDALLPNSRNAFGTSGRPALAVYNGKLYCVHEGRGDDGWVWCATFDGENWSQDEPIPNSSNAYGTSGPPALVVFNEKLYCIREGRGDSGWVWCASFDGSNWSIDKLIPSDEHAYGTSGTPALAVFNNTLYCAREGRGNNGWVWCATFDGSNWSPDSLIPGSQNAFGTSGPPALVSFQEKLYCFREGRSNSGWLWGANYSQG